MCGVFLLSLGVAPYTEPEVPNPWAGSLQSADIIEKCPQNLPGAKQYLCVMQLFVQKLS